jgi:hypothetical protein
MQTFDQISSSINPTLFELAKVFWSEGAGIASGILILVLTIKLTFVGAAIIQGRDIYSELSAIFVRLGIIVIMVFLPVFQPIFMKAMGRCESAGKALSTRILAIAPTKVTSNDPVEYWTQWCIAEVPGDEGVKYTRFSFPYALSNFWGFSNGPESISLLTETMKQAGEPGTGVGFMETISRFAQNPLSSTVNMGVENFRRLTSSVGLLDGFDKQSIFGILFIIVGFSFFMSTAFMAVTCIIGVGIIAFFAMLAGYIGPVLLFSIVMGLGLAAMPLILFDRYKDLWYSYLVFLSSIPLCIFFYFVFSATGFVVADSIYKTAFDTLNGDGLVTRHARTAIFGGSAKDQTIRLNLSMTPASQSGGEGGVQGGATGGNIGGQKSTESIFGLLERVVGKNILTGIVGYSPTKVFEFFFLLTTMGVLWLVSIIVTASVASLGIAFASLAPTFAFAWHQAFLNQEVLSFINNRLETVQGAFMSGLGSGLAQGGDALKSSMGSILKGGAFAAGAAARLLPMLGRVLRK